jgi:ribosomal protein S18 acetylase RimI-like enzyme
MEPIIRGGETYALPRDMTREDALAYWFGTAGTAHGTAVSVHVAENEVEVVGTYCVRKIRPAGGSHVANCGYMVGPWAAGRGVGRAMCVDSIARTRALGFRGIQYNFVVSTNEPAIRLYKDLGFEIVGRLPKAFAHPTRGYVDAYVMFLALDAGR